MDKIINLLGERGAGFFLIKAEREKKKVSDKIPQPANQVSCEDFCLEMEEVTKKEIEAKAQSIISSVSNEISSMWNESLFKEGVRKKVMALPFWERVAILPFIQKGAEDTIYKTQLNVWNQRSVGVDRNIRGYEAGFPKPFTLGMMNVDKDYPKERIGFADNKPYDKWLTEALGEKRPVFFEPYERWGEKMAECYEKVYLVEFRKDQDLLHPPAAVVEPPPPQSEAISSGLREFFQMGNEVPSEGELIGGRRPSRIYGGGGQR